MTTPAATTTTTKAIKFTITGHVPLKDGTASSLQEAANAVLELQKKLEGGTAKITGVKTVLGAVKEP